jgi:hypothetical protein
MGAGLLVLEFVGLPSVPPTATFIMMKNGFAALLKGHVSPEGRSDAVTTK